MNRMPAELLNELFGSLPFENAFGLLAKMPNGLLARNVQKMINGIKMAMKKNKWNAQDCGPHLTISSDDELIVTHRGSNDSNCVRAILPIPRAFNSIINPSIAFYYEVEILKRNGCWGIVLGFCTQQFALEGKLLGKVENSIGIWRKEQIYIDGDWKRFGLGMLRNECEYFEEGNIVGIGIIHSTTYTPMKFFATYNGELIATIKLPTKFAGLRLFPSIHLTGSGDSIHANFGKEEWRFKDFKYAVYGKSINVRETYRKANGSAQKRGILTEEINGIEWTKFDSNAYKLNVMNCSPKLIISEDGLIAMQSDKGKEYKSIFLRANLPIPLCKNLDAKKPSIIYYFEVELLNTQSTGIQIGFCYPEFQWRDAKWLGGEENSIGTNCKVGLKIDGSSNYFENVYGYFEDWDVVGIGIFHCPAAADSSFQCFVTWNGELLGKNKLPSKLATIQLFPAFVLCRFSESIRVNFGKKEWVFNQFDKILQ